MGQFHHPFIGHQTKIDTVITIHSLPLAVQRRPLNEFLNLEHRLLLLYAIFPTPMLKHFLSGLSPNLHQFLPRRYDQSQHQSLRPPRPIQQQIQGNLLLCSSCRIKRDPNRRSPASRVLPLHRHAEIQPPLLTYQQIHTRNNDSRTSKVRHLLPTLHVLRLYLHHHLATVQQS